MWNIWCERKAFQMFLPYKILYANINLIKTNSFRYNSENINYLLNYSILIADEYKTLLHMKVLRLST